MNRNLTKNQIIGLLKEVGQELQKQGVNGDVFLVGGAAISVAYNDRRMTRDVDAVFAPKDVIYEAAAKVAAKENLPEDWFNDSVKGLMPPNNQDPSQRIDLPGLHVMVASPEYLLAMKVSSARLDRDIDDIKLLIKQCGFTTPQQVLESVSNTWGPQAQYVLQPKSRFVVEQIFDQMAEEKKRGPHHKNLH